MSVNPEYGIFLAVSTLSVYLSAFQIKKSKGKTKNFFLILPIFINLAMLFFFKYFNFANENVTALLNAFGIEFSPFVVNVVLPVGISFYTFQALSYILDVYRNKYEPQRHLGIFALYVSFFPQLVAGPIERANNLLPQFVKEQKFEYQRVVDGLKLMLWGFFKKIVIADNVSVAVNAIYNNPFDHNGFAFMFATVLFAIQIYCDFSAYSDIAIGAAQVLGYKLMDNFKRPYYAKSISEFWSRWHISLSIWIRDYIYIPLGGNRVSIPRNYFNIFVAFLASGIWHGAKWTFVLWGCIHGFYLVFASISLSLRKKIARVLRLHLFPRLHNLMKILITFALVNFAWIFFRANSLDEAFYIITHLFSDLSINLFGKLGSFDRYNLLVILVAIGFLELVHFIQEHKGMRNFLSKKPIWIRWPIYCIIILFILLFGAFDEKEFIYFKF